MLGWMTFEGDKGHGVRVKDLGEKIIRSVWEMLSLRDDGHLGKSLRGSLMCCAVAERENLG